MGTVGSLKSGNTWLQLLHIKQYEAYFVYLLMGMIPIGSPPSRNNRYSQSQPRVMIINNTQPNEQLTRDISQLHEKTNLMADELHNQTSQIDQIGGVLENISYHIQYIMQVLRKRWC